MPEKVEIGVFSKKIDRTVMTHRPLSMMQCADAGYSGEPLSMRRWPGFDRSVRWR